MTTAHLITFPLPPPPPTSLYDEDEVEGETILLGKEIQIKRMNQQAMKRNAEERHNMQNYILRSHYRQYLEAVKEYEYKEDMRFFISNQLVRDSTKKNKKARDKRFNTNKKARDKRFKKAWTAILEPLYAHLNLNAMRVASVIEKQRKERALHFI